MGKLGRLVSAATVAGFFLAAPMVVAPGMAGDDGFFSVFEDLPLMPGLTEDTTRGMAFDTPGGRIVEAEATGKASKEEVNRFYAAALPQLGWQAMGGGIYRREGEELRLELSIDGDGVTVRFASVPIGAAETAK